MKRRLLTSLLTLSLLAPALAQPPKLVTSVEGVSEYRLNNGLRVLLVPEPSASSFTVNLTYLVGSRHESYGETGMAHLLEHLLFKGSTNHKNVPQELSEHGARANGTTSYDRTNYFETCQATPENLKWALSLEADRMVNSLIAKKDLDTEMTVVRNEFERGENSPDRVLTERVMEHAYIWHNYGHPTIGSRADIERVPIERLQAFYRRFYQPDNSILIVAGKIDPDSTLAQIQQIYGPIPKPTRQLDATYTREPAQDGESLVTLRRVGNSQSALAAYHVPAASHPDAPALDILTGILGDNPTGRLYKALVETGKATSVGSQLSPTFEPGLLFCSLSTRQNADLKGPVDELLSLTENFAAPTSEELERIRRGLLAEIDKTLQTSQGLSYTLSEWSARGDWRLFFLYRDRLKTVSLADVARVAKTYLVPSNRTLGEFISTEAPRRAEVPQVDDPALAVQSYKGGAAVAAGEVFDPTPENCDQRDHRVKLPGGLEASFFVHQNRGGLVHLQLALQLGDHATIFDQHQVPGTIGSFMRHATKKHDKIQMSDEIDRLKANIAVGTSASSCTLTVTAERAHFKEALRLAVEMLRQPEFDPKQLEIWRQGRLRWLEERRTDPNYLASLELFRHQYPFPKTDPRYRQTIDEALAEWKDLKVEQVEGYYRKVFGASTGQLAVVGDFDPAEVQKDLTELLGDWKSPEVYQRLEEPTFTVAPLNLTIPIKDKPNALVQGMENLQILDTDPDAVALEMANYLMGGGFLSSRLATRIRQKEGLSYGVSSSLTVPSQDRGGFYLMTASCAPSNVPKVEIAMREELTRALKDGFTAEEVTRGKQGMLEEARASRSSDGALGSLLVRYEYLGRRFTWAAGREKAIQALTPESVLTAMRKHLKADSLSFVRAGSL